jgi:dTDP-glucose pyrophosphorylase/CBS domain-containing protein
MPTPPDSDGAADMPLVCEDASVRDAVAVIDRYGKGIALVSDADRRLVATVTDGDVRRGMLAGLDLDAPLADLLASRRPEQPLPSTASLGTPADALVALMQATRLRQIPLLDAEDRISGLAMLDELVETQGPGLRAVVMAGGFGSRLAPLTEETPKPMLPVGDRPLLQRIVEQLRDAGIRQLNVTTHYRAEVIRDHFGDGHAFGVEIEYVSEDQPLGTAGALGLLHSPGPLLIVNADLLTRVDFRAMHRFHEEHDTAMTVAVRPYDLTVPFGIVRLDGETITAIEEKPLFQGFVNAGIYLIEPVVCRLVEPGERLDMPDLIARLVERGERVIGFPLREYWLDIGRLADYEQALVEVARGEDL